jgi:putative nucleotidyltransferase with HDIG domain
MAKKRDNHRIQIWNIWKEHDMVRISILFLLGLTLYLLMVGNVKPYVVDVNIGERAEWDIYAPITIIDHTATERAREQVAQAVRPIYTKEDSITRNQVEKLDTAFATVMRIVQLDVDNDIKLARLKRELSYRLEEDKYQVFITYPAEEIETLRRITKSIVQEIMEDGVSEQNNGLQRATEQVNDSLVLSSLHNDLRMVSREMAIASIVPNYLISDEETEKARLDARDSIDVIEIREGQLLVASGSNITREIYQQLYDVGLLSETANMLPLIGLALFIMLIVAFIGVYLAFSSLAIHKNNIQLLMYLIIFVLTVLMYKTLHFIGNIIDYEQVGFIAPVAFATMLITMLIHQRVAIFSSFIFGLIAAVLLNNDPTQFMDIKFGLVTIFSGTAGAFFLGTTARKTKILQAGFVVSAISIVTILSVTLLKYTTTSWIDLSQLLFLGLLSGIIASVLTIGLMPFFEASFGILSTMKLIELSNPNQPLLRKILVEAPGTYHHSIMVANLAEAASEAVDGNGLLARVGAYYHDVGKTKRPHFFIENQMNMGNPHDKIAPHLSKTIITAHGRDGAEMLREAGLPKAIQDIAAQHHGTTLLKYFYNKAQQDSEADILESDFRYPGPKAQFKEAAIVGIADCIEAAVRSITKPSPERIENMVRNIIKNRLEDGQFNECDLTLKELDVIAKVMCEALHGIFHSRIEYPDDKGKDKPISFADAKVQSAKYTTVQKAESQ